MFDENDSLFINWDRVQYPNGNATYILYLSNFVERVAGPPVRIPQVPYNVNVTLQISAENEWGEGEKSVSHHVSDATWRLSGYTIYFKNADRSDNEPWDYVEVHANMSRFSIGRPFGLLPDCHYKLKISATNERHEGPASEVSWFDTITGDDEDLPAPENVTAYLRNTSLIVHVPSNHAYRNYIVCIRPEFSDQYWKYEATNVTETQETIVIEHFPLDKNVNYQMKISGVKFGRESRSSREFPLLVDFEFVTTIPPDPEPEEITPKTTVEDKRRILKEPPL
ncbi:hypothetical protein COOONC_18851 [Cooperia oncophora]